MRKVTVINSNIKGYHHFKIRPHGDIAMLVEKEANNHFDPSAMIIKIPQLCKIPTELHNVVTKPKRGKEHEQTVKSNAGKTVGRVPANVCKIFTTLLNNGLVREICCWSTGEPCLSRHPYSKQTFKSNRGGQDRQGGGAVIPCRFDLICYESSYEKVISHLLKEFQDNGFNGTERIQK